MATKNKNLSEHNPDKIPSAKGMRFAIVVSEWNQEITFALRDGAVGILEKYGSTSSDICVEYVPGSFELTAGARLMADTSDFDAVICLGCVVKGDTPHFDYVCQGVTQGITKLNTMYGIPFIFGVLTTDDQQQALDRAGGTHGNKGDEAALTAIKMVDLHSRYNTLEE